MATIRQLHVYLDGVLIGEARQSPQGALSFVYDDTYRADAEATPLSLSMPLASAKHRNKQVRAYLEVCPDSEAARARLGPGVQRLRQQLLRAPGSRRTRRRGRSPGAPAGRRNQRRAFKALAFNVLIGGTDAYAKNYSLLLIGPRAQTAPLYDVASAACYPQRQRLSSPIKIGDHWKMLDVNARDWSTVAQRFGIPSNRALVWVQELRAGLPGAFARAIQALPADVRAGANRMADRILEHVEGTWRPDLDRHSALVLRGTSTVRPADTGASSRGPSGD